MRRDLSTSNSDLKLAWPTIKKDKSAHAEALRDRDESDSIKDIIDKEEPQNVGPNTKEDDPAHATERIKMREL